MRKKTDHSAMFLLVSQFAMSSIWSRLFFVIVVFICNEIFCDFAYVNASSVLSKLPCRPRKLSCILGELLSRLRARRSMPASFKLLIVFGVSSGVAEGVMATVSFFDFAYLIIAYRSGRLSGSPPVMTSSGGVGKVEI